MTCSLIGGCHILTFSHTCWKVKTTTFACNCAQGSSRYICTSFIALKETSLFYRVYMSTRQCWSCWPRIWFCFVWFQIQQLKQPICIRLIHAPGINRGIACTRLFIQHIKLLTYDEMSFSVLNCSLHCRSRKIVRSMVFSISVCSSSNNNISMEDLIIIILKAYLNGSAYCSSPWLK